MTLPLWTVSCWRWRVREPIDQTQSCFKATLEKDQVSEVDLEKLRDRFKVDSESEDTIPAIRKFKKRIGAPQLRMRAAGSMAAADRSWFDHYASIVSQACNRFSIAR
jgi:hypothetical protein